MTNTTITPQEIIAEAEGLAKAPIQIKDTGFVLRNLLKGIEPVNFHSHAFDSYDKLAEKRAKLEKATTNPDGSVKQSATAEREELKEITQRLESFKLFQKHYLIIVIEQLLKIAKENSWSLCQRQGFYYIFNGIHWQVIEEAELKAFLGKVAEKMGVPKFDSRHYEFKDKLFKQFEASAHLPEPKINDDTVLVNFPNGTAEITSNGLKLREHREADFLTYVLSFEYDPKATAPRFKKFLDEVLPDKKSQQVLAEFMGYIFTRNLKLEKILFLFGSGRNGKSVMFEIIRAMLGENNMSFFSLTSLTDDAGYHRAKLLNKQINWASDIGDKLQSNTFKQLASGEPIECRLPYKEPFLLQNICKFAFNTNTLPTDVEHTSAFFERFLIVPFDVYIEPEKRDPKLAEKIIKTELPGIFNWVLDGLNMLLEQEKFSPCPASDKVLADFKKESDSVALFLDETGYQPDPNARIQAKTVYNQYREYCFDEGLRPLARKNFTKRMESLGCFSKKENIGKVFYIHRNGQQ